MKYGGLLSLVSLSLAGSLCIAALAQVGGIRTGGPAGPVTIGALQSSGPAQRASPAALSAELGPLFGEWKAIETGKSPGKASTIKARVDAALTTYVAGKLGESPRPSTLCLQDDLNRALKTSIWESVFGVSRAEVQEALKSNASRPLAFVLEGSGPASVLYVAAFAIGYGNVFSTRVHGFGPRGGKYRAVNPEGTPLGGAVSDMVPLRPFAPDELRFVIWSLHIGSPEALTSVAVDKFDGSSLQTLWTEENVPGARVTLQEGLVVIESRSPVLTKDGRVFNHERTLYHQTSLGLKQEKITRWTER